MKSQMLAQPARQLSLAFEKYGQVLTFSKGQTVYIQEDDAERFFLVKKGMLRSYVIGRHGRDITLELLRPGKIFGSASFFMGIERFASVAAMSDAEVLSLDSEAVRLCFGEHFELAVEIFRSLGASIQFLVAQVENLTIIAAGQRIAHTLLKLALDFKKGAQEVTYTIPYTHQQIAELAGMSRVTTTKELNRFAELGWISLGYRKITVRDETALQDYVSTAVSEADGF